MSEQHIIHTEYSTPFRRVLSASTLAKDSVLNRMNENVGSIKEIMIDVPTGRVAYAVLSVGGFLGIGERLFAVPWEALTLDEDRRCFILDADKQRLENAPGFDKDNWPDMADSAWGSGVSSYWYMPGATPSKLGTDSRADDAGIDAAGRYDRDAASFSAREVDRKAGEARQAIDSPEGEGLRQAEQIGKPRSKAR